MEIEKKFVTYFCTRCGPLRQWGYGEADVTNRHIRKAGHRTGDVALARDPDRARELATGALRMKSFGPGSPWIYVASFKYLREKRIELFRSQRR